MAQNITKYTRRLQDNFSIHWLSADHVVLGGAARKSEEVPLSQRRVALAYSITTEQQQRKTSGIPIQIPKHSYPTIAPACWICARARGLS